jgi:hypothetical protein
MTYKLSRLAPGSYDVLLNGVIIASLVRSGEKEYTTRQRNSWWMSHRGKGRRPSQR